MRTAATLALAVCGPVMLLSGLFTLMMIPTGVSRFVATVFVVAAAGTALSLTLYLFDDAGRRRM